MKWDNLSKGMCPKCDDILQGGKNVTCPSCGFKIKMEKYLDLIKGRKSQTYKKATRRFEQIKKYKAKIKAGVDLNIQERVDNERRRMLRNKL